MIVSFFLHPNEIGVTNGWIEQESGFTEELYRVLWTQSFEAQDSS
jgi:hypothetical protein